MYQVRASILEQLKKVPREPGVYLMKDRYGHILYVGKAKRLRDRLSSYFHGVEKLPNKTRTLVVNIAEFEYILVSSEDEALLLEANFIKKHRPKFNVLLKDDKSYPLVRITEESYPRVLKVRNTEDRGRHFGPFTNGLDLNLTLEGLKDIYPIRRCDVDLKSIKRPCLYYHMEQCIAPCLGVDMKARYAAVIAKIENFFRGDREEAIRELSTRRDQAAADLDFERAILLRDQIRAMQDLSLYQKVTDVRGENQDILGYAQEAGRVCVTVLLRREGKIQEHEHHVFHDLPEESPEAILEQFIMQYYSEAAFIPEEILVSAVGKDKSLQEYLSRLRGAVVRIHRPQRGEKRHSLRMAERNAREYLLKFVERIEQKKREKDELRIILNSIVSAEVHRIEAYDISHMMGAMSVGSMVVFEDFSKKSSDYRKFRIRHEKGPDDLQSMREMIERRLARLQERGFGKAPDLICVDGGATQVATIEALLQQKQVKIPVLGMVKDAMHRTDALYFEGRRIELDRSSNIYRFFYQLQEEVHRFAISYHQKLRGKSVAMSLLDEISHVGEKRKIALLTHFGSIDAIMKADVESLRKVAGMDARAAKAVYDYFH